MRFIQALDIQIFLLQQVVTNLLGLGFGVLRLLDALGQILASVQLTGSIVVPPQEILGGGDHWRFLDSRYLKEGNI